MFKIGNYEIDKALLLAPMEDVTSIGFRKLCKEFGADLLYTEFVNSEGLVRKNKKTHKKMSFLEEERPLGIQIYGAEIESMLNAAKIAESELPDMIDINAGCWVKKVAKRGAGAGLLKDPPYMQKMIEAIVQNVQLPVTVKTRLGWDRENIMICDVAKRIEDAGAQALTIHCRTRADGHSSEAQWDWIPKIKEVVSIPVALNGGVMEPEDVVKAFKETGADGVMIARGSIGNPWIFQQAKELLSTGKYMSVAIEERIQTILKHLKYEIKFRDNDEYAVIPFRKFYSGYLKGLYGSSKVRQEIMLHKDYNGVEYVLLKYLDELLKSNFTVEN